MAVRLGGRHEGAVELRREVAPRPEVALRPEAEGAAPWRGPALRPRRNRKADWSRRLVREHELTAADLIWPLFVAEPDGIGPVASMPGVERLTVDGAARAAERAATLGIPAVALFPRTPDHLRCEEGREALSPANLVCRAVRAAKRAAPHLGVIADVALDPYTSHGHDGLLVDGDVANDPTVRLLVRQALVLAEAGADAVAPSDMMDGRVGALRAALDAQGFEAVQVMSYAAKYASAFYGPFREAVGSGDRLKGDKRTYQMDPGNAAEALREAALDAAEGADLLIIKPGMPYLDVLHRVAAASGLPTLAYQVSGEYAMIEAAAANGWIDGEAAMLEALLAFKRAGAAGVLTYHAPRAAERLRAG